MDLDWPRKTRFGIWLRFWFGSREITLGLFVILVLFTATRIISTRPALIDNILVGLTLALIIQMLTLLSALSDWRIVVWTARRIGVGKKQEKSELQRHLRYLRTYVEYSYERYWDDLLASRSPSLKATSVKRLTDVVIEDFDESNSPRHVR